MLCIQAACTFSSLTDPDFGKALFSAMATRPPRRAAAASASTKRKALDDGSEKENSPIADEVERPKKKTKPSAAKTAAKKKQGTIKAAKSPTPTKLFNDTVKTVAKEVKKLDTAVKNLNPNNKYGIHIDSYIDIALSHVKVVQELAKTDIARKLNLRPAGGAELISM